MLPTLTGVARLVADPELRVTQSGTAVASIRLAFNSRRKNDRGEWEDGDTLWVRGTCWRDLAEHAAETLAKGMEVVVVGELRTESWERDGQKQQAPALLIRAIGPNLAHATARVQRPDRDSSAAQTQHRRPQQQGDPWDTNPATATAGDVPF
ncbi:hypothetical protein AQ490_23300 [Wenjunlia vitaminophila]|uniref:Single-stranded DNA-binding protein n=1 Tax=Wenjunlia vitaminophila TaxID=76728 RepID=A0A0T6LRN1_WENVI|nr:single-stranded DNA-binding protein [Wenjunlia vitaminophila]KRV48798.1 hypothetical protein AQ490_23300 [Wenjunlia vitaminophila]